jgi:GDP-L-fucose synthase
MNTSKVLVTGSNGQLGKAVIRQLKENGIAYHASTRQECDLSLRDSTLNHFEEVAPTCVLHLAAFCGGLFINQNSPVQMLTKNTQMAINIFEAAHRAQVQDMVVVLSTCVFPAGINKFKEEDLHSGPPHHTNFGYAHAKRMMAVLCDAYNRQHGRNYIWVAPCNLFGHNDTTHHVIGDLCSEFRWAKDNGQVVLVRGTGSAVRQFLWIDDAASILLRIIGSTYMQMQEIREKGGVILAPPKSHSIGEIVSIMARIMDKDYLFSMRQEEDGQITREAETSFLSRLFPDLEFMDMEAALKLLLQS